MSLRNYYDIAENFRDAAFDLERKMQRIQNQGLKSKDSTSRANGNRFAELQEEYMDILARLQYVEGIMEEFPRIEVA